jgi:hypothetical protein
MAQGPTAPEDLTSGKDLAGGFIELVLSNTLYRHRCRLHVAPFTSGTGGLGYVTPPAGLFSDADPTVTASALMALIQPLYTTDWSIRLNRLVQMVNGQPQEVLPVPSVAGVAGSASTPTNIYAPAGQITLATRDTQGKPFRFVLLGSPFWQPIGRGQVNDNASGTSSEKLVHFFANNGAVRSHAGNKPIAPMWQTWALNNRLRREYHQR